METREGQDLDVRREPEVVVSTSSDAGTDPDGPPPAPPRRRLVIGLAALLALALAVVLVLFLVVGGDDRPVKATAPVGDGAVVPAALGMTVELPDTVVAGQNAEIVVRWTDGEGVFSGTSEDWGDGVGTSSLAQDQCTGVATDRKSADRYTVKHAWSEPGSYQVVLGVTTYLCTDGSAVQEDVSKTVSVQVLPAR
jgi:hypothetical protein